MFNRGVKVADSRKCSVENRRRLLLALAAGPVSMAWGGSVRAAPNQASMLTRAIPSSGQRIPVVGLGTWITFNVGADQVLRQQCVDVMRAFFEGGGALIDSSPMYGSAQAVTGYGLKALDASDKVFSADKVWISAADQGAKQIQASAQAWGVTQFDLLQVHNLVSWQAHLETLNAMKQAGTLRYVGITTSEGRRHDEFERIMRAEALDFVQFTYNLVDREAEQRLLPLARDRGIAVIVNRPFQQGGLVRRLSRYPLPEWAVSELGVGSWAQFVLKFIVSHPDVTCVIPATTRVEHVRENLDSARGVMPDTAMRERMASYVRAL